MKVTLVYPYTAPAKDSQGIQRLLEGLARALVRLNHEVYLLINADSVVAESMGNLVSSVPVDTDIVHYFGGLPETYGHSNDAKYPWISVHMGGANEPKTQWLKFEPYTKHFVSISSFIASHTLSDCVVYAYADPDEFIFSDKKDDYFLWLAGTDWGEHKGLISSIVLAKKLGFKLKIAGSGRDQNILNLIHSHCNDKIEYVGSANGKQKAELFSKAKAFLNIGKILDAFCITNVESLLSGTPIIARNIGVYKEILNKDVAFLCDTDLEITKAIMNVNKINPYTCRKYALENFTPNVIVHKYLQVYQNMIEYGDVRGRHVDSKH